MTKWTRSLDFPIGVLLIAIGLFVLALWPDKSRVTAVSDLPLWFGIILLGTGLVLDLWRLLVVKVQPTEQVTSMCVESVVGTWAVVIGLVCVLLPWVLGPLVLVRLPLGALVIFVGACFVFAAWLHDLVWIRRGGRWMLMREPEHGSFILFAVRKREAAKSCEVHKQSEDDRQTS